MNSKIKKRAYFIFVLVTFFYGFIVVRLYSVQVENHEKYRLQAIKRHNKPIKIKGERGTIFDRNGEILAYSGNVVDFMVYTPMLNEKNIRKIAARFSSVFNKDSLYYYNLMKSKRGNVWLAKNVPLTKAIELKGFEINGLKKIEKFERKYPFGQIASHVLGFVNKKNVAINGVEKEYDKYLKGKDGFLLLKRDGRGKIITIDEERSVFPEKGGDIYLTIDISFQKILEKALSDGVKYFRGKSAIGIIEDPNTGEIIAMANIPNFDPNNYNLFSASSRRNRAITDAYEPGSTMKSIFMSVLLNENKVNINEQINTENGVFYFKGHLIRDTHKHKSLSVREVIEYSSNIGMAKLSERISSNILYKYLRNFGFGIKTGIDLPGEGKGIFSLTESEKTSISRGYSISVTGIQLTNAYSALVNGGILYSPFVVKKIVGRENSENKPEIIRRVIKSETSSEIKNLLIGVVENGTAKLTRFENMLVGGKTGTTKISKNREYLNNEYYTSFIGYFPSQQPKYVCYIWVERPQREKVGGLVAAPIFKRVVKEILKKHPEILPEKFRISRDKSGYERMYANIKARNSKRNLLISSNVAETREKHQSFGSVTNKSIMPNLIGKSKREAIAILNELGLNYIFSGHGKIKNQSIKPGTKISENIKVKLKCSK